MLTVFLPPAIMMVAAMLAFVLLVPFEMKEQEAEEFDV